MLPLPSSSSLFLLYSKETETQNGEMTWPRPPRTLPPMDSGLLLEGNEWGNRGWGPMLMPSPLYIMPFLALSIRRTPSYPPKFSSSPSIMPFWMCQTPREPDSCSLLQETNPPSLNADRELGSALRGKDLPELMERHNLETGSQGLSWLPTGGLTPWPGFGV